MAVSQEDDFRERRITMEILVDVYDEHDVAPSWYAYLENSIAFPFTARCMTRWEPFRPGDGLLISGMALPEECDEEIFVNTEHEGEPMVVPLTHIEGVNTHEQTRTTIEDWHYWISRGYEFPRLSAYE